MFCDPKGSDRLDLIDSLEVLGQDTQLLNSYLKAVDLAFADLSLETNYFQRVAHDSGLKENGATLALNVGATIGIWISKVTQAESDPKHKQFGGRTVVGTYVLRRDDTLVITLESPSDTALRLSVSR